MLNIVLVSGGTGSKEIQKGFDDVYGYGNYHLDVVINAYDNGKSTGLCREVFDKRILGPSDLRKNQLTQYRIVFKDQLKDKSSYEAKLLALFELRFSAENHIEYYQKARRLIEDSTYLSRSVKETFLNWLVHFFFEDAEHDRYRKTVEAVRYEDFSLSNIFYASCASLHENSLGAAGREMSSLLGIEDCVHLISDVNLFLKARTESGAVIADEEEIVGWKNPFDKIEQAMLEDENGDEYLPVLDERNTTPVEPLFRQADVVIFSCGTQWSSLIPTYMHKGFRELVGRLQADKYLIMNNAEDEDMAGMSADDLLLVISRYLDMENIKVVLNDNAAASMRQVDGAYTTLRGKLSLPNEKKHIGKEVIKTIMSDHYRLGEKKYTLVSDLDGTLWDEKGDPDAMEIGRQNLSMFRGVILSGNSYEHVYSVLKDRFIHHGSRRIYCDYGNTFFTLGGEDSGIGMLTEEYVIHDDVAASIERDTDFSGKVTVRGKVIITIKPLKDRAEKLKKVKKYLRKYKGKYEAKCAGRTSIDIMKKGYSKAAALEHILSAERLHKDEIIYIGNELLKGNETCIQSVGVRMQQVDDVYETYMFLKSYFSGE